MKRTQIQLPEPLYDEVKRVAELQDWSITEVMRRGAEYMVAVYPADKRRAETWSLPEPMDLGELLAPPEDWREIANDRGDTA